MPQATVRGVARVAAVVLLASFAGIASAHDEIFIGQNSAGQIVGHFKQSEPLRLFTGKFPGVDGWASAGMGIEALSKDEPTEDLFMLPETADIKMVLESADTNMHLFNENASAFVPVGGTYNIGTPFFHLHPFWNLTEGSYGTVYQVQVSFFDASGQLTPSDLVPIQFVPACPGDVNLSTTVDTGDILALINSWGECLNACETVCAADLDFTCTVNAADLLIVINSWGPCIAPP